MGHFSQIAVCIFLLGTTRVSHGEIEFIAERLPLQGMKPDAGTPWPMPASWIKHENIMKFDPDKLNITIFDPMNRNCDILKQSLNHFRSSLQTIAESITRSMYSEDTGTNADENQVEGDSQSQNSAQSQGNSEPESEATENQSFVSELHIDVMDLECPNYPTYNMSEKYTLTVNEESIHLRGQTVWGIVRGLETLLQLFHTRSGKWQIQTTHIEDSPRFAHRGLHLDTSRHFYPLDIIKKNLDAMAMNKFNVFHWHIVDAQSFPYESIKFPELSRKGAYSPTQTYSQSDVAQVIEYARVRGIRVLVEFDTPGHAHSWGKSMPELLTPCYAGGQKFGANYSYHAERENFDPTKNSTFIFLKDFFDEVKDVFPDEYLHLGMDEAHYMCWESSPEIADFMESLGFGNNYTLLEQYYNSRLLKIVQALGKKSIIWEDPLNHGAEVPHDTIVQVWKNYDYRPWTEFLKDALRHGYDVILSSCWYLNYIKYGQDWRDFYSCEPTAIDVPEELLSHIVGGEACVWSEYFDETNVLQNIWPRASAVAERLWSNANLTDTDQAAFRLDQHRCRMLRFGIPAKPILPGYCREDYNTDNENVNGNTYNPGSDATTSDQGTDITDGPLGPNTRSTNENTRRSKDSNGATHSYGNVLILALMLASLLLK